MKHYSHLSVLEKREVREVIAGLKEKRKEQIVLIENNVIKVLKDSILICDKWQRGLMSSEEFFHKQKQYNEYIKEFFKR